jgi:peptidyl-prolyl cis-trans isomerase SurA
MKNAFLFLFLLIFSNIIFGQTLATFGSYKISQQEFLAAFRKNNVKRKPTAKDYRDYLNLYIRYRLKVQAALDKKIDTIPRQITELQNFKNQIADQYTNDESSLNIMAEEAFHRSQRDIRISYIFIPCSKNTQPADTLKAWNKIQEAYNALKTNKDFGEIAVRYSADPFVKNNRGDIGYITVFDLPYTMESVSYQTPLGKISSVFRTDGGYMIVKKTADRPAKGRIRIAQILIIFPYQATDADKTDTKRRADSVYHLLLSGADFGEAAKKFSGDNLSYQTGGIVPEFGIGKYETGFEEAAFSLKKDGDLTAPFSSSFGYHIIKRISVIPVSKIADKKILEVLKEKIKSDPRIAVSRKLMVQAILKQTGYREIIVPDKKLWSYTDSVIQNKKPSPDAGMNGQSLLFTFPYKSFRMDDWVTYRRSLRSNPALINGRSNADIFASYLQLVAFEYYKKHLEEFNPRYAAQVAEFRDGNLLFDIMQTQVWDKAASDSTGLRNYFESHSKNYWWKPGANAIIFNGGNRESAAIVRNAIQNDFREWKKVIDNSNSGIQADSGRFEIKQIPGGQPAAARKMTDIFINSDKSARFAYIIHLFPKASPRNFEEAKGLAINDYQNDLENKWIDQLKKKYPVVINEKIFNTLTN